LFIFILRMKKWIIGIVLLLALVIAGIYLFIPSTLEFSREIKIKCNPYAAFRSMGSDLNWKKWAPSGGGYVYRVTDRLNMQVNIAIEKGGQRAMGRMMVLRMAEMDSAVLHWDCSMRPGSGPVARVLRYREALAIRREADEMLSHIRAFVEKVENVYGMKIHRGMSKDSALVVTEWKTAVYPGTKELYEVIGRLRSRATRQGAKETDPPMLHVGVGKNGGYEVMAAIPVDKLIKGSGDIFPQRFVPWKAIIGETRGGAYTAEQAMIQLRQFIDDHQYPAMAIPFQSLVTERDKEADTSRWVTRVIVPVP
jgi:hypothetical protein